MLWSLLFVLLIGACKGDTCECSDGEPICPEGECPQGNPACQQDFPFIKPESDWILSRSSDMVNNVDYNSYKAEKAVDEDKTSCAKTKKEEGKSWWMIDLQCLYDISSIAIYNTGQDNSDMKDVQIYIGTSCENYDLSNQLVKNITDFKTDCWNVYQTNTLGRYITVSHPGEDFSLCEVRINATKTGPGRCSDEFPFNPTYSWITSQSSDFVGGNVPFNSTRAIDGKKTVCAHTKKEQDSWWMIDLLGVYNISSIAIYNILHHNINMTGARIHIGYSCKNHGTDNKLVTNITDFKMGCWNFYPTNTSGRYITVFLPGIKHLILCEVRINATEKESPFVLIRERKTWENALEHCRANHRDLASILDEEEQAWAELEAKEADTEYVWLGLHYTCVLEFWFWVADYPLGFHHWAPKGKKEECGISVAMKKTEDHRWFSESVYDTFNFLCEK